MIRLRNITRNENTITCTAFLEDCKEGLELTLDLATQEFQPFEYPKGYECCRHHIWGMARWYLVENCDSLPAERLICWY